MKSKKLSIITLIMGILSIWLVLDHILKFEYPDYFYNANPGIDYYVGINVVSMVADLSFFTYHTLIMFSLWCILLGISSIFNLKKIYKACTHRSIVVFIFTNYLITSVLYTVFELASGNPTFGLYALNNKAIHNLGTNIFAHYIFFLFDLYLFIKLEKNNNIKKNHYFIMITYLIIYFIYVKISGLYMYDIIWYPYPIFDLRSILDFEVLPIYNYLFFIVLLIASSFGYYYLLFFINKISKKK